MNIKAQIKEYILSQPEPKRSELQQLHDLIVQINPKNKLWFLDGKDENNKIITNPNIGFGSHVLKYADGKTKDFYRIGISANTTGISIYFIGIQDKKYLSTNFGCKIGKANITGYCIKFKSLKVVNLEILEEALRCGFENNI